MNDYVIGSGALLTAGPAASIAGATLHAQTEPGIASGVRAALVDFEALRLGELSRVLAVGTGLTVGRAGKALIEPLLERRECTLADVLEQLARACNTAEVHVFARWLPGEVLAAVLRRRGVQLVALPLEAIRQAALICGQIHSRWPSPLRAA